jgi:hypothetical protein
MIIVGVCNNARITRVRDLIRYIKRCDKTIHFNQKCDLNCFDVSENLMSSNRGLSTFNIITIHLIPVVPV